MKELELECSVCASVCVREPVSMCRVSVLGFQFLSPMSVRRSTDSERLKGILDAVDSALVLAVSAERKWLSEKQVARLGQSFFVGGISNFLKKAFSDYGAEVAVDFHEYRPFRKEFGLLGTDGICSIYDAMFMHFNYALLYCHLAPWF